MTKLAELISIEEGGWKLVDGKLVIVPGTLPARYNNPGDLRHGPHEEHDLDKPNAIGKVDTLEHGRDDLERQLKLYANRKIAIDPQTNRLLPMPRFMTLGDAIYTWAPTNENNSSKYLRDIVNGFGGVVDENTPLSTVLTIQA